ncbi:MAG: hypothetical protein LBQ79_02075 [Deltaproteobacteria bacterium]|nr:hypothetical protein [Deltaproteobacteria bacterium]
MTDFVDWAYDELPEAFPEGAPSGEVLAARGLEWLRDTVFANDALKGMLCVAWLDRIISPPFIGPLRPGSWRVLLFAMLEFLRAGRGCAPIGGEVVACAMDSESGMKDGAVPAGGPEDGPALRPVPEPLALASGELLDACRARGLMTDFDADPDNSAILSRDIAAAVSDIGGKRASDTGGGRLDAFLAVSEMVDALWRIYEGNLEVFRDALQDIAASGAGKFMPGIDEALELEAGEFASRCRGLVRVWAEAAEGLYVRALDAVAALDTLREARRVIGVMSRMSGIANSGRDIGPFGELMAELDSIPDGSRDWEERSPTAAAILMILRAPKPIDQDVQDSLYNTFEMFSMAFFNKLLKEGEFDSALKAGPPSGPVVAAEPAAASAASAVPEGASAASAAPVGASAASEVEVPVGASAASAVPGGTSAASVEPSAASAASPEPAVVSETSPEPAGEAAASGEPAGMSEASGAVTVVTMVSAEPDGPGTGAPGEAVPGPAESGTEEPDADRFELKAAPEEPEEPEEEEGERAEAAEPDPAELAERSALAALEEESAPYSHRTDPFREFWGMTAPGIARLIRLRFGDLLDAAVPPDPQAGAQVRFEDFRRRPSAEAGLYQLYAQRVTGGDGASGPGGEGEGGSSPGGDDPDSASAFATEGSSLAAAIRAQAVARGTARPDSAADAAAESLRGRDFRRHLSALCRRLAGDGDTRPLCWLASASPGGVFPEPLARLLHLGIHFRPYPAAAREAFASALGAAAAACSDPAALLRDPEPALFAYASLLRGAAACSGEDMAQALDALGGLLPERLRGGLLEALVDLNRRAEGEGVVKALRRMSDDRDKDRRLQVLNATTEKFLEDMPKRSTSYVPANTVWKNLITSGGDLYGLLERCRAGGGVAELKAEAEDLRNPARVRELVNMYDRRSGRKEEISAAAFTAIAFYCGLTADLCGEWLEYHGGSGQEDRDGWTLKLIDDVFREAGKAARAMPEPAPEGSEGAEGASRNGSQDGRGGPYGPGPGNGGVPSPAGGPRGYGSEDGRDQLPADGARILVSSMNELSSGTFMDCWGSGRGSASAPEGFHAADPEADLASWLVLCRGASSEGGSPSAPLAGIVDAVASAPWSRTDEDKAFAARLAEGEAVVPALFLEAVDGAGERLDEGGRRFRDVLGDLSGSKIDEAEAFAEDAADEIGSLASSGALDANTALGFAREAEAALDAVLAAAPEADARAAASAASAAAGVVSRAREAAGRSCELVRARMDILRERDVAFPGSVTRTVLALLDDDELDAASDIVTEHVHRSLAGGPPMQLADPSARSRTADFFRALPELKGAQDVFAAARDLWAASRTTRGLRAPVTGHPERLWEDIRLSVAHDSGEAETAAALEKLVRWLDFGTGKGASAVPGPWGGGHFPWREYSMEATCEPPLPAWGPGPTRSLSLLVWHGDGASPGHLMEALNEWDPGPGTAPVALALSPLTTGVRGLLWGWARENRRDIALLDPALMASIAAAAPTARAPRLEWLFSAGGIYGAFRPYERTQATLKGSGRAALFDRICDFEGVMRLEGPAGSGKSSLLELVMDDPSVSKPSDGNWAALVDWTDVTPDEISRRGAVGAVVARAAADLDLPGWDASRDVGESLRALDAARGRKGSPSLLTVAVDSADGLLERCVRDPADLALLKELNRPGRVARLLMAGRRVSMLLERHPSSPLAELPEPEPMGQAEAAGLWETLCGPLIPMGWVFETPTLPYRVMARAFWNHGALAVLAKRVLAEAELDSPPDGPPPFKITERAVARAVSAPETTAALAEMALSAVPGPRHRAACLVAAYMEHAGERDYPGSGLPAARMLQNLRDFWPEAFRDADLSEIRILCSELCDMGLMAADPSGPRFRTAAAARLMGDQDLVLDELSALKDMPAPPDSRALSCRRILQSSRAPDPESASGPGSPRLPGRTPEEAELLVRTLPEWIPEGFGPPGWASPLLGLAQIPAAGSPGAGGNGTANGNGGGPASEFKRPRGRPRKHPLPVSAVPAGGGNGGGGASTGIGIPPSRIIPETLPSPSPLTLLQEAELFGRGGPAFTVITGSHASGAGRAAVALLGLCRAESRSGASASAFFPVRGGAACSTAGGVRSLFDQTAAKAGPDGETRLVANATGEGGPGSEAVFRELGRIAGDRNGRREGAVKAAYLCSPEEALARRLRPGSGPGLSGNGSGAGPPAAAPGYLARWSPGALELFLAECGLDPALGPGVMERTGGWDGLVLSEVHRLAGRPFAPPPAPGADGGSAPRELDGLMRDLRTIGPVTVPEAAALYPGLNEDGRAEIAGLMGVLAGLTVLVPSGERSGETVWAIDPRLM